MKLQRDARVLKSNAISSLRTAMTAFNSYSDDGRLVSVLLHLQHACEMLLKAALSQKRVRIFDKVKGQSFGFEKCLNLCRAHGLSEANAGTMRAIDLHRDNAQHWYADLTEDLLYLHVRAAITAFDEYLKLSFADDIRSHIPPRVLPVSTQAPGDFEFLVDREYRLVAELLLPGRRQRGDARAKIRSLLAMEALVQEGVQISEKDVDRIERAVRDGLDFGAVFPRLLTIDTRSSGEGIGLKVVLSKRDGAPIRYVGGDDVADVAAIREVDLSKKYHMRASELAKRLKLTPPKCKAIRAALEIDDDASCTREFSSLSSSYLGYSDNALRRIREALEAGLDMEAVWEKHRPRGKRGVAARAMA